MQTNADFRFYLELTCSREEKNFLYALWKDPRDQLTRAAYADWLEEHDRSESAVKVRNGYTPAGIDLTQNKFQQGTCSGAILGPVVSGMLLSGFFNYTQLPPGTIVSGNIVVG